MEHSLEGLRDQFLDAIIALTPSKPGHWLEVWRLFVEHPAYQAELQIIAARVLNSACAPPAWLDDLKQDAMLLLSKHLRHAVDLHVDHLQVQEHFAGWLSTIILHDCQQALRSLRRAYRRRTQSIGETATSPATDPESLIDLSMAIEKLPDPSRTVAALYVQGYGIGEIADELGLSYWQAYRAYRKALSLLARIL